MQEQTQEASLARLHSAELHGAESSLTGLCGHLPALLALLGSLHLSTLTGLFSWMPDRVSSLHLNSHKWPHWLNYCCLRCLQPSESLLFVEGMSRGRAYLS